MPNIQNLQNPIKIELIDETTVNIDLNSGLIILNDKEVQKEFSKGNVEDNQLSFNLYELYGYLGKETLAHSQLIGLMSNHPILSKFLPNSPELRGVESFFRAFNYSKNTKESNESN